MQAFVLAAGLGTRLKPLTDKRPKALVEVQGQPLLKIVIDKLIQQGISHIVINVHHFADLVCTYIQQHNWDADILISDERDLLLDTGGGLRHAAPLFLKEEPILIHNVDILSHIDFNKSLTLHTCYQDIATLFASKRDTSRYLLFNEEKQLVGWENIKTGEVRWVDSPVESTIELAFSGMAIVEPQLLELLPPDDTPYPIIPAYLNIAKHHRISYIMHDSHDWLDVGKPDTLTLAQQWKLS